jgi:hypothetical protein
LKLDPESAISGQRSAISSQQSAISDQEKMHTKKAVSNK